MADKAGEKPEVVVVEEGNNAFHVLAHPGMTEKWRKDRSVPLIDVVTLFSVFRGTHGADPFHAAKGELEGYFGSSKEEEVIKQILEKGVIHKVHKVDDGIRDNFKTNMA